MFPSTQPGSGDESMRVSDFRRQRPDLAGAREADAGATRLSALNPSLLQDLLRFEDRRRPGNGLDMLEVLAAALRHNRSLLLHLQLGGRVIPVTVLPASRQVVCQFPLPQLLTLLLSELRVLCVEPARPPDPAAPAPAPQPMGPLVWEMALRGARSALLPEISGVATYRVNPAADLQLLDLSGPLDNAVRRLRKRTTPLRELTGWPGFDRDRAMRLLNGLYLQAALIVSRSHPGAINGL